MENSKTVLLTGGAGFIGSALVRYLINATNTTVVNVDKLTYAGSLHSLGGADASDRHHFHREDIVDANSMRKLVEQYQPDYIMHLAAESHVDRSIDGPGEFIQTNIVGTYNLLQVAREYYEQLEGDKKAAFKFHHISTDEVYGSLGDTGLFTETTRYKPNSPYSASKASSDHLVRAWNKTYKLPVVISNCSNNYGPFQFPEKLVPLIIQKAIAGEPLPIYGKGSEQITFVADRPGHDRRYAIDAAKIERELGWTPEETFESGIRKTVEWYLGNAEWIAKVSGDYDGGRLGSK